MSTNSIGPQGCSIQSLSDVINEILNGAPGYPGFYQIYGNDINVNPNSPDGQMVNIFAQAKVDTLEQLQNIYDSFDPDQATGTALDQRCAINGVIRQGGTYTQQIVNITTIGSVSLTGLSAGPGFTPFTVQDGNGNQYYLLYSAVVPSATTAPYSFQAAKIGAITSAPNTITVPVTILQNVTAVNNPTGPTTTGVTEETDLALRIRRANAVALPSQGYNQGLVGALLDIQGVTGALVLENLTGSTDGNGIPGHSIWTLLTPSTSSATIQNEIAQAIYVKRNAGCGMKGSVSIPIIQLDSNTINILYDWATPVNLWFKATVDAVTGSVDLSYLTTQIVTEFGNLYGIGQTANATDFVAYIKALAPNAIVSGEGVSNDGTNFYASIATAAVQDQYVMNGSSYVTLSS